MDFLLNYLVSITLVVKLSYKIISTILFFEVVGFKKLPLKIVMSKPLSG